MNQTIEVKKVLNDGKHLKQSKDIVTFVSLENGYSTPNEIWVGTSEGGIEITQPTKEECIVAIRRNNMIFRLKQQLGA